MYKEKEVGMDAGVVRARAEKCLWGYLFHTVPSTESWFKAWICRSNVTPKQRVQLLTPKGKYKQYQSLNSLSSKVTALLGTEIQNCTTASLKPRSKSIHEEIHSRNHAFGAACKSYK